MSALEVFLNSVALVLGGFYIGFIVAYPVKPLPRVEKEK